MGLTADLRAYARRHPRLHARLRRVRAVSSSTRERLGLTPPRAFVLRCPDVEGGTRDIAVSISPHLYVGKVLEGAGLAGYEPEALACFLAITDIVPDGPVWDVGCNIGVYSLIAATATRREVVAFEPTPHIAAAARSIVAGNGLSGEVRQTALGESPGSARLFLSDSTDSSNSLRKSFRESTRAIDVPVETIDGLVASGRAAPSVLKIDTETTEPAVLRGGLRTITATRPWIMCEVLAGRTESELMAVLEPLGYTYYLVSDEPEYEPAEQLHGDPRFYMWVFAPEPAPAELWARIAAHRTVLELCGPTRR
jgi:FkbM family methyltransferase